MPGPSITALLRSVRGERRKQDMALELGVTPASYGRWERGEHPFPPEHLPWLSEQAGVELVELNALWSVDAAQRALGKATNLSPESRTPTEQVLSAVLERLASLEGQIAALIETAPTPAPRARKRQA